MDCGVHYVDVMCMMTGATPIRVSGIGARLTDEVDSDMYNYGHLQVTFDDGSVGWYEAGWGPMMSETAFFIKDVIGPKGCVSIVDAMKDDSSDIDSHTQTGCLRVHHSELDADGNYVTPGYADRYIRRTVTRRTVRIGTALSAGCHPQRCRFIVAYAGRRKQPQNRSRRRRIVQDRQNYRSVAVPDLSKNRNTLGSRRDRGIVFGVTGGSEI